MKLNAPKLTYQRTDAGETIVSANGDRLGFVRNSGGEWFATDTYFVGLRGSYRTRKLAVAALLRRKAKEARS
jgi:hypothetical protein